MSGVEEWVKVLDHRNYTAVKTDFGNGVCLGCMQFILHWIFIRSGDHASALKIFIAKDGRNLRASIFTVGHDDEARCATPYKYWPPSIFDILSYYDFASKRLLKLITLGDHQ